MTGDDDEGSVAEAGTGQGNLHDDEEHIHDPPAEHDPAQDSVGAGTDESGAEDADADDDLFPVERPADLTEEHLPQQLRDEIERPLRAMLKKLGRSYVDVMDARNDVITQLDTTRRQLEGAVKMSQKDSQRINQTQSTDSILQEALVEAGVAEAPDEVPEADSAGDQEE